MCVCVCARLWCGWVCAQHNCVEAGPGERALVFVYVCVLLAAIIIIIILEEKPWKSGTGYGTPRVISPSARGADQRKPPEPFPCQQRAFSSPRKDFYPALQPSKRD